MPMDSTPTRHHAQQATDIVCAPIASETFVQGLASEVGVEAEISEASMADIEVLAQQTMDALDRVSSQVHQSVQKKVDSVQMKVGKGANGYTPSSDVDGGTLDVLFPSNTLTPLSFLAFYKSANEAKKAAAQWFQTQGPMQLYRGHAGGDSKLVYVCGHVCNHYKFSGKAAAIARGSTRWPREDEFVNSVFAAQPPHQDERIT